MCQNIFNVQFYENKGGIIRITSYISQTSFPCNKKPEGASSLHKTLGFRLEFANNFYYSKIANS